MAKKKTEQEYLEKFKSIHNNKYSYDKFPNVFNQHTRIGITCPIHGHFEQIICNHANGMGCPKCGKESMSSTKVKANKKREKDIEVIRRNYENEYDFSKSDFQVPYDSKVKVICKQCHKEQYKRISDLIKNKAGCSYCRIEKMQKTFYQNLRDIGKENFIKKANELYNYKYDYSNIDYKGNTIPIEIICPIHGAFYKKPINHIYGLEECPICRAESIYSKFEEFVAKYFIKNNIVYIPQYFIKTDEILKNKPYDFYLPDINLLIEIDGPQHRELCWDMTNDDLERRKEIDKIKTDRAILNGFNLLRIPTNTDIEKILKEELNKYK